MLTMTGFMVGGRWSLLPEFGVDDAAPSKVNDDDTLHRIEQRTLYTREAIPVMAKGISTTAKKVYLG